MPFLSPEEALREAYASAPTDVVVLETIELRHPAFLEDGQVVALRFVNDMMDLDATLEADAAMEAEQTVRFVACPFEAEVPDVNAAAPELRLKICNVSREVARHARAASKSGGRLLVTYRSFVSSDTSAPAGKAYTLTGTAVEVDLMTVTLLCGFPNLANRKFPSEMYTTARFPGLAT